MRIEEISDQDKIALTLKGLEYEFEKEFSYIKELSQIKGNSFAQLALKSNVEILKRKIELFLNEGFAPNEPEVLRAKQIYDSLG
jgi:hypothetical protein